MTRPTPASSAVPHGGRSLRNRWVVLLALAVATGLAASPAFGDEGRVEALEKEVAALREQVAELAATVRELIGQGAAESVGEAPAAPAAESTRVSEIERRQGILAEEMEELRLGRAAVRADVGEHGFGPAASKVYRQDQGVSLGGYGELRYQGFSSTRDDGSRSGAIDEFDLLRSILYVGYKFDDKWIFNSEIEWEHASTSTGGSVSVEFAYLDYLWKPEMGFRAGLVLVPMGFVNELHEPTTFLGARRPETERRIIPSTWRENGFGIFGDFGDFSYRTYVVNGLEGGNFDEGGLRGGRQKGGEALANDLAWVGRLDWSPRPGLLLGASAYVGDSGQGLEDAAGVIGARTTILEGHFEWQGSGWSTRALWAQADVDDADRLNALAGAGPTEGVAESLSGGYVQVGYDVLTRRAGRMGFEPFVRYEVLDTQDDVAPGFVANPSQDREILTLGFSFRPIDQLVFKVDWQDWDDDAGRGRDQWNFGLGYIF